MIDVMERSMMRDFADKMRREYDAQMPDATGNIRIRSSDVLRVEYIVKELLDALSDAYAALPAAPNKTMGR